MGSGSGTHDLRLGETEPMASRDVRDPEFAGRLSVTPHP
jgi:hypothetical protein